MNDQREDWLAEAHVEQELSILTTDISLQYSKYFNRQVKQVGLTAAQWKVLSCLARNPGITQTEVAEILHKGKSPVGKTLDALENAGWISRTASQEDRRVKSIFITNRLESLQDSLLDVVAEMNSKAEHGLNKREVHQVRTGLEKIRHNLAQALLSD